MRIRLPGSARTRASGVAVAAAEATAQAMAEVLAMLPAASAAAAAGAIRARARVIGADAVETAVGAVLAAVIAEPSRVRKTCGRRAESGLHVAG